MITWFGSFTTPVAEIFRDDARADVFYYLPHRPRIATDAATGEPIFFYHLVARDAQLAFASGTHDQPPQYQIGMLGLHVDLSLSPEDLEVVKQACRAQMAANHQRFRIHHRVFGLTPSTAEPTISAINTWLDGTARIDLVVPDGPTFKLSSTTETKPSLYGTNGASFAATFGAEGAQLMYDGLGGRRRPGDPPPAITALPIVYYNLKFAAKSPALKVTVTAHGSAVYKELRETTRVTESTGRGTWSYPQVSELTKALVARRAIEIVWDDGGLPDSMAASDSEVRQQIEENLISLVTTKIVETFFTEYQVKGLQEGDLGDDPFLHSGAGSGKPGNKLWLREYKEEFVSDISFSLTRTQNTIIQRNPNTLLSTAVAPELIAARVKFIDVGNPEAQVLQVAVYTNADFANDNIANVTVNVTYDQADSLIGGRSIQHTDTFTFQTGKEAYTFVTRMARDRNGRLIDLYDVTARINYIGRAQSPDPIVLTGLSERALTVSYDRLGFVKVDVQAGDVDWKEITQIFVDLEYPPAAGQPDARKQLKLTQDHPTAAWSASKRGSASNSYRYTVRYAMKDGSEQIASPRSDDRGTLVIHDLLAARLRRTFDVVLDPGTVKAVMVRARYRDEAHGIDETARNLFSSTGSWDYSRPVMEGAPRSLDYSALIQYADGAQEETPWRTLAGDESPPAIAARRHKMGVIVDGSRVDWTKWSTAYVQLEYEDAAHGYLIATEAPLRVTAEAALHRFDVLAFSPSARTYRYRITLVPMTGDPVEVPADGSLASSDKGLLLLHTLVP
jgi:hypothetical protein